jgi:DNA-binding response OmpR family regulator
MNTPPTKTKVLVVEDDPHIRLGLEEVLKSDGFDVTSCERGDRALASASITQP